MGYYTTVRGRFTINPPIPWGELRDTEFIRQDRCAYIEVEQETVETDDGTLTRRQGIAIVPYSDSYKAYDLTKEVQEIVDRFSNKHTFAGRFECYGEDNTDIWRLEIHGNKAAEIRPKITWPDGTEVEQ